MGKEKITELIKQAKANNQTKTIQKVVPIETKKTEEVQFSFYIEKELLKKLKLKALQEEKSIKHLINNAIKSDLK